MENVYPYRLYLLSEKNINIILWSQMESSRCNPVRAPYEAIRIRSVCNMVYLYGYIISNL